MLFRKDTLLLLTCFILIAGNAFAQNQAFKVGETMTYDVYANVKDLGIKGKVGILESRVLAISNVRGIMSYHIYARVYNTGIAKAVYIVDDRFELWVSTNTFTPVQIVKHAHEGTWIDKELTICHFDQGYYLYNDKITTKREYVTGLSYDVLGLVYFMRFVNKKESGFTVNWIEGRYLKRDIPFKITEGSPLKTVLSKDKIPTTRISETQNYGMDALISKEYNQIPLDVIVSQFEVYGMTIQIRGILKSYKDGK